MTEKLTIDVNVNTHAGCKHVIWEEEYECPNAIKLTKVCRNAAELTVETLAKMCREKPELSKPLAYAFHGIDFSDNGLVESVLARMLVPMMTILGNDEAADAIKEVIEYGYEYNDCDEEFVWRVQEKLRERIEFKTAETEDNDGEM